MRNPIFRPLPLALLAVALLAGVALAQDPGPVPVGNHYKCYDIIASDPFTPLSVSLRDQFGLTSAQVIRPRYLCNPVSKNGGSIPNPSLHLVCYEILDSPPLGEQKVRVRNQFGLFTLKVDNPNLLCLPSSKIRILPVATDPTDPAK